MTRGTSLGICLVIIFLGSLAVLPLLALNRSYTLEFSHNAGVDTKVFPLDSKLSPIGVKAGSVVKGPKRTIDSYVPGSGYLLVNFWASWCAPCIEEIPSLDALSRQLRTQPTPSVTVLALSVDEQIDAIGRIFKKFSVLPEFVILHDDKALLASQMGTLKFPETYLLDHRGAVLYKWVGAQNWLSREVLLRISDAVNRKTSG